MLAYLNEARLMVFFHDQEKCPKTHLKSDETAHSASTWSVRLRVVVGGTSAGNQMYCIDGPNAPRCFVNVIKMNG